MLLDVILTFRSVYFFVDLDYIHMDKINILRFTHTLLSDPVIFPHGVRSPDPMREITPNMDLYAYISTINIHMHICIYDVDT